MLDELFKRSIIMVREEKGIWYQIYRILLQFREEATGRVFRFLRGQVAPVRTLQDSLSSLLDDKVQQMMKSLQSQLRLIAEKESAFWKKTLGLPLKNYPRKLSSVNDAPLYSGSGNWFTKIFEPVKKRMRKIVQYSISQNHSIDQTLDKVFGKDLPKEIKVQTWRGTEFQGGVLAKVRKSLQTLVTTSTYEMVSKVRKFAYARTDRVTALRSVSVWDTRTTSLCQEYNGLTFDSKKLKPIGHSRKFIPTPRHWNCRAQYIPEDFDGKVLERKDFSDWFKGLSHSAQNTLLGSRGGELYRNEEVPLLNLLKRLSPRYLG